MILQWHPAIQAQQLLAMPILGQHCCQRGLFIISITITLANQRRKRRRCLSLFLLLLAGHCCPELCRSQSGDLRVADFTLTRLEVHALQTRMPATIALSDVCSRLPSPDPRLPGPPPALTRPRLFKANKHLAPTIQCPLTRNDYENHFARIALFS